MYIFSVYIFVAILNVWVHIYRLRYIDQTVSSRCIRNLYNISISQLNIYTRQDINYLHKDLFIHLL